MILFYLFFYYHTNFFFLITKETLWKFGQTQIKE